MEFELDIREDQSLWAVVGIVVAIVLLFGLAKIGQPLTPYQAGVPRLLRWSDWTLIKAEKIYAAEVDLLRQDVDRLAGALDSPVNPVQTSLLAERVLRDTSDGTPTLSAARLALAQAALDTRDWSAGILDRESAIASLETAIALLQ